MRNSINKWLCLYLNGRTVSGIKFSGNYNVIITNCAKKDTEIKGNSNEKLFENQKSVETLAEMGSIKVVADIVVDNETTRKSIYV